MNAIRPLVLVVAWTLLATPPTRADAPAPAEATVEPQSPHSAHSVKQVPVPDCPHCRKAGLLVKPTEATPGSTSPTISVSGAGVDVAAKGAIPLPSPTPRDPSVSQAQVLSTPGSSGPTIPEISTESSASRSAIPMIPTAELAAPTVQSEYPSIEDALITTELASPLIASQRPQRVPNPSLSPLVGAGSELATPARPTSLPTAASSPVGLTTGIDPIPSSPSDEEPKLPELPDDLKSSTPPVASAPRVPPPVLLPAPGNAGLRLVAPSEELASPVHSSTKPDLAIPPLLDSNPDPAPVRATATRQGPSARILAPTPLKPTLAMPPPAAGTFDSVTGPIPIADQGHEPSPLNGFSNLPVMIGDQSPASMLTGMAVGRPPMPGQPPTPPSPFARTAQSAALVPWARGFKIADNQSPMPQDRVFYSFNYFNNMNGDVNRRLGSPISDMQVYRQLLGIEKTFWKGNASVGVRLPIDTLWTNSAVPSLRNNSTSVGDLTVFTKFLLYDNPVVGNLLSGGLAVTAPTGPSSFAGSSAAPGFRNTQIQPFLGYILRRGDFYLQGFSAIDIPTDSRDVTMWYNDLAVGYFVYQSADPSAFLSAVVPTFEVHLNDPLNHRGALRPNDPAGTPDVLDLTFGTSFILRKRLVATVGCSFPVTGPRPFDVEAVALLNFYYGRYGMAQPWPMPPVSR
ncbi:hypothetical protein SAMN05444166_0785 [Singulisphaera sp. GP187]|uniref:hypothetical protein n=1 Tax=Singulisphaera sp. GP187 TaxID=1882752 RepID=UPI00092C83B3|nr:hypothetical protein [Singulisphaera sp. GP187]SIN77718.1 hypothetical protein SAMN05444166_0785 [Singulisphaera sp. GP187]